MPNGTTATVREILERPFPPEAIQTRPSAHGPLSYVATWRFIQRLNETYGGAWTFEIAGHEVRDDVVLVVGKLIAPDCTKMAFGSAVIAKRKDSNEVVDLGDSVKAAASDALKKCCSLLGLGLHLWADGAMDNPASDASADGHAIMHSAATNGGNGNGSAAPSNGNGSGNGHAKGVEDDRSRLSSKQLGLILALARERGISREKLNQMADERFNRRLEFLARIDASSLISELQAA